MANQLAKRIEPAMPIALPGALSDVVNADPIYLTVAESPNELNSERALLHPIIQDFASQLWPDSELGSFRIHLNNSMSTKS
jgi:hypothetical protein